MRPARPSRRKPDSASASRTRRSATPPRPSSTWNSPSAPTKGAEAKKLLEGRDEREVATLLAGQLREDGDFPGARSLLESLKPEPGSPAWHRVLRSRLSLAIESGDNAMLDQVVGELAVDRDLQIQGEGIFAR